MIFDFKKKSDMGMGSYGPFVTGTECSAFTGLDSINSHLKKLVAYRSQKYV